MFSATWILETTSSDMRNFWGEEVRRCGRPVEVRGGWLL